MHKRDSYDMSNAFFNGSEDDDFDERDNMELAPDESDSDMYMDEHLDEEIDDDLEVIDIDDLDDDETDDSEDSEDSDDDQSFTDEQMFDPDYEDQDVDDEHSEVRRDIWSNIDWDKD